MHKLLHQYAESSALLRTWEQFRLLVYRFLDDRQSTCWLPPPQAHGRVFTVAASYGPDDEGPVRRSAETCAGKFLDISSQAHAEAAKVVAAERPQIFVDLMAHTTGARCGATAIFCLLDIQQRM